MTGEMALLRLFSLLRPVAVIAVKRTVALSCLILAVCVTPLIAESGHESKLFLDNDSIRLGIDLTSGGSIFYLSDSSTNRNVLNHFDRGRYIQQSYYGDEDGSRWGQNEWRWNPVQGGDYKGQPAKVLEHKAGKTTLYVKSTPKHWANGSDITDAVMEQWISLEGTIASIKYRFTYNGEHNHRPRHQEMPAVFVDASLPNLVLYRGDKPWRMDALTTLVPGWPNEYHRRTEEWSAFVDDNNWGIGVYTPGTTDITCYRYSGPAGSKGSGCSYFSPIRTLGITHGLVLNYDVYLTMGSVPDIRKRFYSLHIKDGNVVTP